MRPSATIQVTTIELVTGKPNGRAISTAFCDRPMFSSRNRHHDVLTIDGGQLHAVDVG